MTKFKHILAILLIVVLCLSITLVAVACDKGNENNEEPASQNEESKETETLLIANGRFAEYTSSTKAPYVPTSWSGTASDTEATTISGVVPMNETEFNNMSEEWDNLTFPGTNKAEAQDKDYALMIYNKTANAYTYKPSSTFTATIGSYYKFSVDFKVVQGSEAIATGSGAYVTFTGDAIHTFGPFAASDKWQTVTFYVAASEIKSQSITIALSLGIAGNPTTGYVFFDDMIAEKISAADFEAAKGVSNDKQASYSMLVPDGNFVNTTGTANPKADAIWSGKSGTGTGSQSPTTYVKAGVISTEEGEDGWEAWKDVVSSVDANVGTPYAIDDTLSKDKKILAISNKNALSAATKYEDAFSAYGFTNSLGMNIAPGTVYKLSVWVYTDITAVADLTADLAARSVVPGENPLIHTDGEAGANVVFTGFGDYSFNNINTNKTWKEYTFYILGSETDYKTVNLELWLGKGGTEDLTRVNGTVYFDSITLSVLETINDRDAMVTKYNEFVNTNPTAVKVVNMTDSNPQLIANGNFDDEADNEYTLSNWTLDRQNGILESEHDVVSGVVDDVDAPYAFAPVLKIQHKYPTASYLQNDAAIEVVQNLHYKLTVWVKTEDIAESSGLTIALFDADSDSSLSSFTSVNTAKYENDMPNVNGYAKYSFFIKGSTASDETKAADNHNVYVKISFGSGNNFTTTSYLSGTAYIANISMKRIDASEYTAASSGTYVKTYSFASSSGSTSGAFSDGSFDVISYDEDKVDTENGNGNQIALYKPSSWTLDSVTNVESGILNVMQPYANTVKAAIGLDANDPIYNTWAADVTTDVSTNYNVDFSAPNLFVAYTTEAVKAAKVLHNSSTVSMSKNNYYVITGYVRAINTVGEIELTTTGTQSTTVIPFGKQGEDSGWQEVMFVVKTGSFGSVSGTVNLYIGAYSTEKNKEDADKSTYQGAIFADGFSCRTIDENAYTAYVTNEAKNAGNGVTDNNFITYTFDSNSTSTTTIDTDTSAWSGTGSSHTVVKGIYSNKTTESVLKYLKKELDENEETKTVEVEDKQLTRTDVFDTTGLDSESIGDYVLVINNQEEGYYHYRSASITFESKKSYRISLVARTYNIAEGKNATLRIAANDNYDIVLNSEYMYKVDENGNFVYDADGKHEYTQTDSAWHKYVFYIQNNQSSSVTATLDLCVGLSAAENGTENSAPVQGTALFDNITMEEIDSATFLAEYGKMYKLDDDNTVVLDDKGAAVAAEGSGIYALCNTAVRIEDSVTPDKDDDNKDDDDDNKDDKEKTDSSLIWLYVTSIVIAAILIVVIVVWLVNRNKKALKAFFNKLFKRNQNKNVEYSRGQATQEEDKAKGDDKKEEDSQYND